MFFIIIGKKQLVYGSLELGSGGNEDHGAATDVSKDSDANVTPPRVASADKYCGIVW